MMKSSPIIARNLERLSPSTTRKTPIVYKSILSASSSSSIRIGSLQNHHGRVPSSNIISPSQSVWFLGGKEEYTIPPFELGCAQTPPPSKFEYGAPTTATNTTTTIIRSRKPKHVRRKFVLDGSKQNFLDMVVASDADDDDACRISKNNPQDRINRALPFERFDLILGNHRNTAIVS